MLLVRVDEELGEESEEAFALGVIEGICLFVSGSLGMERVRVRMSVEWLYRSLGCHIALAVRHQLVCLPPRLSGPFRGTA